MIEQYRATIVLIPFRISVLEKCMSLLADRSRKKKGTLIVLSRCIDQHWLPLKDLWRSVLCSSSQAQQCCYACCACILCTYPRVRVYFCVCARARNFNPSRIALLLFLSLFSFIVHSTSVHPSPPPSSRARVDFKWHSRERNDSCQIFDGT